MSDAEDDWQYMVDEIARLREQVTEALSQRDSARKDAERLDWLDREGHEQGHGFSHMAYGDYRHHVHATYGGVKYPSARDVIDAAMWAAEGAK